MSTQTATPLWKQFLGACAGAVAAVMIYEAFLVIPSTLQAWTTIPTAPGVTQDRVEVSDSSDTEAEERLSARAKLVLARFAQSSSSSLSSVAAVIAPVQPSSSAASSLASSSAISSAASSVALLKPAASGFAGVVTTTKSILTASSSSSSVAWAAVTPSKTSASVTKAGAYPHANSLPNSGLGLWVAAVAAFGAAAVRFREHRMSALRPSESLPS